MAEDFGAGVVFLTAPAELARRILVHVRERFPGTSWRVYHRADHREALGDALAGTDARIDKPPVSKLAFVREIRKKRFDVAVVAWTGAREYDRMKLVGIASRARRLLIYNENVDSFYIEHGRNPVWVQHVRWRMSSAGQVTLPFRSWLVAYRWTLGLAIGCLVIGARLVGHQARRFFRTRRSPVPRPARPSPGAGRAGAR